MLLEVVITALLVGLITVATLTGFSAVDQTTAAERQHDEAASMAAQSQEELRSDPASTLELLETSPHQYTQTNGGNTFTITQQAKILGAGESSAACSVTNKKRQSANSIRVTSTVTWPEQQQGHRPAVTQQSIVTPPVGSGLEIDAGNAPNPTAGIAGLTASVQYTATKGGATAMIERATGSEGCTLFTGIPATSALVSIKELSGYVTTYGSPAYPPKEVTLAPNYTTHDNVTYNRGGAIQVAFTYNGEGEYKHSNNEGTGEVTEAVRGDTFVTYNLEMKAAPDFEVGSTRAALGSGGIYEALPGTYEAKAISPEETTKYPNGNLFPFLGKTEKEKGENPWTVYAGDCPANSPETVTGGTIKTQENVNVSPAETTSNVKVPTSYVALSLYKGTKGEVQKTTPTWKALEVENHYPVTITNTNCAGQTPNNEATVKDEHTQETTTEAPIAKNGGHLLDPFQPFGEFELCVYAPSTKKTYTVSYANKAVTGGAPNIYLGQLSTSERATAKSNAENAESTEEIQWKKEYTHHTIKEAELNTKESEREAGKTTRKNREKEEEAEDAGITVESGMAKCP